MDSLKYPFSSILSKNCIPTDEDVVGIHSILAEASAKVVELDDKIDKVTLELQEFQEQQEEHERLLYLYRAYASPIKKIPEEILVLIFRRCLPTAHDALMSAADAPILLTHVCQAWRTLALGTEDIWSSIYIPIPTYPDLAAILKTGPGYSSGDGQYPEPLARALARGDWDAVTGEPRRLIDDAIALWRHKMEKRKNLIIEWLRRAGNAELSITVMQWSPRQHDHFWSGYSNSLDSSEDPIVEEIVEILKAHAAQWRVLELSAVCDIVHELLSLPASDTPNIEAIKIMSGYKNIPLGREVTPQDYAKKAKFLSEGSVVTSPTLRSLDLQRVPRVNLESIPTRWNNLTKFVFCGHTTGSFDPTIPVNSFTPSQALELLERCPNLVECGMAIGSNDRGFPPSPCLLDPVDSSVRQVSMMHLESLWVHEQGAFPLNNFFVCLDVPRLTSLKFITKITPRSEPDSPPVDIDGDALDLETPPWAAQAPPDPMYAASPPSPIKPWYPPSLPILLRACGPTIKSLELDYTFQTKESLEECLSLVPNVEELRLSIENEEAIELGCLSERCWAPIPASAYIPARMDDRLFRRLFIPAKGPGCPLWQHSITSLCPRMTSLYINPADGLTEKTLLEFVKTRRSTRAKELGVSPLKSLKVEFPTESDVARERRRRELTRRGVNWVTGTEWVALQELEGVPEVDLDGFRAEVTWPVDPALLQLLSGTGNVSVEAPWSPAWALDKVTRARLLRATGEYFR